MVDLCLLLFKVEQGGRIQQDYELPREAKKKGVREEEDEGDEAEEKKGMRKYKWTNEKNAFNPHEGIFGI